MGSACSVNVSPENMQSFNTEQITFTYHEEAEMLVISFEDFKAFNEIPRSDVAKAILQSYSSLQNRRDCLIIFISHCWLRGAHVPPHPDDTKNSKHQIICEVLEKMTRGIPPEIKLYLWIDFACIDQDNTDKKMQGVASLPAYIERSDALLTPYTDSSTDESENTAENFSNPFSELWISRWPDTYHSLAKYCSRAWCRLEMCVGSNAPLALDGFHYFNRCGLPPKHRPHFVYGDYQKKSDMNAEVLPKLSHGWMAEVDPREGLLTNELDRVHIGKIVGMLKVERHDLESQDLYAGDLNEAGQRHGHGEYRYDKGSIYRGDWRNGKRHGKGVMEFEDGARYDGEWQDGEQHGHGKHTLPTGDSYEGCFSQGKYNGHGVMLYASGDRYEGGWKNGLKDGVGSYFLATGAKYEGEWKANAYEGHGTYTFKSGARFNGLWKEGVKHGQGTYHFKAGVDLPKLECGYINGKEEGLGWQFNADGSKLQKMFKNGEEKQQKQVPKNSPALNQAQPRPRGSQLKQVGAPAKKVGSQSKSAALQSKSKCQHASPVSSRRGSRMERPHAP